MDWSEVKARLENRRFWDADIHAALAEIERRERRGMGHTLPDQQCSAIEHKALRLKIERLEEALEEWLPPHSAACCMPNPGDGTFPEGPLMPNWCRCNDLVKRSRAALRGKP